MVVDKIPSWHRFHSVCTATHPAHSRAVAPCTAFAMSSAHHKDTEQTVSNGVRLFFQSTRHVPADLSLSDMPGNDQPLNSLIRVSPLYIGLFFEGTLMFSCRARVIRSLVGDICDSSGPPPQRWARGRTTVPRVLRMRVQHMFDGTPKCEFHFDLNIWIAILTGSYQ